MPRNKIGPNTGNSPTNLSLGVPRPVLLERRNENRNELRGNDREQNVTVTHATTRKINNLEDVHCVREAMASGYYLKKQFEMIARPRFGPAAI
jgi:hypothetical protein